MTTITTTPCPVCGSVEVEERAYRIKGHLVVYKLAVCAHSPEEYEAADRQRA